MSAFAALPVRAAAPGFEPGQVDAFIEQQMARHRLPGLALAITQGDQVLYLRGYGARQDGAPVTPQTPFYLASLSKSFTALAVLQLVEAGQLALDTPVQRYLPEFTTQNNESTAQITVRHLLNQTSGLADSGFPERRIPQMQTPAERLHSLRQAQPVAPPGQAYHYFNPNYEILARLVEVTSGQPFSQYLQAQIFDPLGMQHTASVTNLADAQRSAPGLAQGHVLAYGLALPFDEMLGYVGGSGGVISTAEDMARYLILYQQQGQAGQAALLSPESLRLMHSPPAGIPSDYGMGWLAQERNGRRILEHNGIFSAYYAETALLPDEEIGIVLLYNASALSAQMFAFPQIKDGLIALALDEAPQTGGFSVLHWGLLLGLLTLLGIGLAVRSLARLPVWRRRAAGAPAWRLAPGILWAFTPAALLLAMPSIVAAGAGRFFSDAALLRSMPEIYTWLGACALLGTVNGALRLGWLLQRGARPTQEKRA